MGDAVQTMPRRLLGGELKRLRIEAGKSLDDAARTIGKDRSRIVKVEDGRSNLRPDELELLLDAFGASKAVRKKVLAMGVEARQRQPKRAYVDLLPGAYRRLADLEVLAAQIFYYDRGVIPGLLQIPEYTEAQMAAGDGVWWDSSYQERTNRVAFRLERQRLIFEAENPKQLVFIFTDDALTTLVGGPKVMRKQLEHLLGARDIVLRLISAASPNNPVQGDMVLLRFDERTPPVGLLSVAYGPSTYLDEPVDIQALTRGFERLQQLAFSAEESRRRIEEALEGIDHA